ncbi:type II toxin-antitoxin system VapC family toxin [Ekhidna sp.]|uniref:type II toxin-antitoxin system VapC family toxin n=1 Tax=Ekhidna sp. TaxID=2608089 RepID=UPI0032EEB4B6
MDKNSLVLCDTNILIEFYKENQEILKNLESIGQENIAVSIVTVGELLFGALNKKELKQINKDLSHLHTFNISDSVGEVFTRLMTEYTLSHNLGLPDGLIAATAIAEDIPLYTLNMKDFKFIKGLKFLNQ